MVLCGCFAFLLGATFLFLPPYEQKLEFQSVGHPPSLVYFWGVSGVALEFHCPLPSPRHIQMPARTGGLIWARRNGTVHLSSSELNSSNTSISQTLIGMWLL